MFSRGGRLHWDILWCVSRGGGDLKEGGEGGRAGATSNNITSQVEKADSSARKSGSSAWATRPLDEPCPRGICCLFNPASACTYMHVHTHTLTHRHNITTKKRDKNLQTLLLKRTSSNTLSLHTIFTHTDGNVPLVVDSNSSPQLGNSSAILTFTAYVTLLFYSHWNMGDSWSDTHWVFFTSQN